MAVTQGHGNPDWTRDEVILALELFHDCKGHVPGPTDERILALSELLRSLPIHPASARNERFRNPDGVVFKLQNIRQVATGKGLGNTAKRDREVWADLGEQPDLVKTIAAVIRASKGTVVPEVDADEEFREGRIVTATHMTRERSASLRRKVLSKLSGKKPACEACNDGPKIDKAELWDASFEVHHKLPLAATEGDRSTRLQDVALLCASCHRAIHRLMSRERRWVSVEELSKLIG